jgi:GNAT superfamily N-acetyltransferase
MTPADVDPVAAAFVAEGWGDRRLNLEFMTGHAESHPFVADVDGTVIGTGVVTMNGPVGWIGTIWVEPAWRRRGVGTALTRATIETAEAAGGLTLVLVATEVGRPIYESFGFEIETWYRILEAPGLPDGPRDRRIRPYQAADLPAMAELSTAATGEDRMHLLAAFASPETAACLIRADGTVAGFVVRAPWGGASTVAPQLDEAEAILHARRIGRGPRQPIRAGLLSENEAGLDRLLATGWTESWRAPRLVRGDSLRWQPEAIWGQFNFGLG